MAAGNDEEFAGGGKFRPSVAAVGGELRKRSEDVELRDGSRRLAQARGLGSDAGAQIDEKLALDFEDALVGGEDFALVFFQFGRGEALGVDEGLLTFVIGGREMQVGF